MAPGTERTVSVPWKNPAWTPGSEYFLTVRFRLKQDAPWADKGFIVAWDQIAIPVSPAPKAAAAVGSANYSRNGEDWVASANGTSIRIDSRHGWLSSLSFSGTEMLSAPLHPNFWRAPTDNDIGWKVPEKMGAWKDAPAKAELQSFEAVPEVGGIRFTAHLKLPVVSTNVSLTYLLRNDGTLSVALQLETLKSTPELPRIGVQFAIPEKWNQIKWFGRGPQETYWDRKTGAAVGLYQSSVSQWITHYVRPQENANRTDIRWAEFTAADGSGLRVRSTGQLLGVSAWPYSLQDLEQATHDYQLKPRDFITVNVDGWQMGIGGDISWGLPVHDPYRLLAKKKYEFSFEINPIGKEKP